MDTGIAGAGGPRFPLWSEIVTCVTRTAVSCGYDCRTGPQLNKKAKGDLAELKVATDLMARGHKVAIPYGEDWDFDLVLLRAGQLERVQVKYGRSDGSVLAVRCRSESLTNGKVRATKHYTAELIDCLAVWDAATDRCFYVPSVELGAGRSLLHLRLAPSRNGQVSGIRFANRYLEI